MAGRIRIVIAEPAGPAEGDDRGAQVVARALRDAGMEVVYTGLHQTPEQIVQTAIQEDADAVGLPGALDPLRRRVIALLADRDAADVLVLEDGPGSDDDIVARVRDAVSDRVAPDTG